MPGLGLHYLMPVMVLVLLLMVVMMVLLLLVLMMVLLLLMTWHLPRRRLLLCEWPSAGHGSVGLLFDCLCFFFPVQI